MKFATIGLPPSLAGPFINGSQDGSRPALPPMQGHECALWLSLAYYQVPVKNGTTTYNVTESYTELGANSEQDGLNFQDPKIGWAIGDPPYYGLSNHQYRYALLAATANLIPYNNSFVSADWASGRIYRFGQLNTGDNNLVQGIYRHSDDLQSWTRNLAQAITNNIAAVTPAPRTDRYDGSVYSSQTYFKIRWCRYTIVSWIGSWR
ncbi:hypothetical protein F5X97DRAFT_303984 [Nemania serpens]|nr:hypothetical protein F5X97DRAFT_303984 [Nemania serpens]